MSKKLRFLVIDNNQNQNHQTRPNSTSLPRDRLTKN